MPNTQLEKDLEEQKKIAEENKKNFEAEQAKAKELEEKAAAQEVELEGFRKFKSETEAKVLKQELEAKEAKRAAFMSKLESDKLVTPATKELIGQLLGEKQEFSLDSKPATREEIIEKVLSLTVDAAKVNFEENSLAHKFEDKNADEQDKKIKKYMEDNKCSYQVAYKSVMKEQK